MLFAIETANLIAAADMAGVFCIIMGIVWIVDLLFEIQRKGGGAKAFFKLSAKDTDWDMDSTTTLKIISTIACWSGPLYIVIGGLCLIYSVHTITAWVLIIMGIATFLKPVNDIPIAGIIGALASVLIGAIVCGVIMVFDIAVSQATAILLLIIIIIIGVVVMVIWKFWLALPKLISIIVSFPIVSLGGSILAFVIGVMALLGLA